MRLVYTSDQPLHLLEIANTLLMRCCMSVSGGTACILVSKPHACIQLNILFKYPLSGSQICGLQEPKRGQGTSAVFIARNRFAVLDKGSNQIVIKNLNNEITKKAPSPCATTDAIFYAGTGTLLCRSEDKVLRTPRCPALMHTSKCNPGLLCNPGLNRVETGFSPLRGSGT